MQQLTKGTGWGQKGAASMGVSYSSRLPGEQQDHQETALVQKPASSDQDLLC